jgi:hypothetical protein
MDQTVDSDQSEQAKLDTLLEAARTWRFWQHQPITRSAEESARRNRACDRLLKAIDGVLGDLDIPPESITCPLCGRRTRNPQDVAEGYCGGCHDWTSPPNPPS